MTPQEEKALLAVVEKYRNEVFELRRLILEVQSIALRTRGDVRLDLEATIGAMKRHVAETLGSVQTKLDMLVRAAETSALEGDIRKRLLLEMRKEERAEEAHSVELETKKSESVIRRQAPVWAALTLVITAIVTVLSLALASSKGVPK